MKKIGFIVAMVFATGMIATLYAAKPAYADRLGNGSTISDNLQIGVIKSIGNRQLTINTKFEKVSKTYTLHMHPEAYVMTADRGVFKKFVELKKGDLIAAYGWYRNGKWNARRIDILDPNDYLVKRLAKDAKAGFHWKHER
jgi:hypothetical protein